MVEVQILSLTQTSELQGYESESTSGHLKSTSSTEREEGRGKQS